MRRISEIVNSILRDSGLFNPRDVAELGRRLDNLDGTSEAQAGAISGSGGAPVDAPYITIANTPSLAAERRLSVDSSLTLVDSGANGTATLSVNTDTLAGEYLLLDASNDPVTGALDIQVDDEHALRVLTSGVESAPDYEFPSAPVLDNFNRADEGPPPSADWDSANFIVASNQLAPTIDEDEPGNYNNILGDGTYLISPTGIDQEVYLTCYVDSVKVATDKVETLILQLRCRMATAWYMLLINVTPTDPVYDDDDNLLDYNSFEYTGSIGSSGGTLATLTPGVFISGDAFGLSAIGDQIKGYHRTGGVWSEIASATDSSIVDIGQLAIHAQYIRFVSTALPAEWTFDDFGGGDVVNPVVATTVFNVDTLTQVTDVVALLIDDEIPLRQTPIPASAVSNGSVGDVAFDADWVYICIAENTWVRAELDTW